MNMKKILLNAMLFCTAIALGGCSDFFETNTDDMLNNEDYISEESEIYSGYIGILTKMQEIGDKSIYLYETRGEVVEPTTTAPRELYSLYNYENDLTGNSYADPSGYYELINACNDYMIRLKDYKENHTLDQNIYKTLISGSLRIKAWTFLTIAKLYGKVVWVDKPMNSLRDLSKFKTLEFDDAIKACKNLLDIGYDDIDGTTEFSQYTGNSFMTWANATETADQTEFGLYDRMTPPYFALYGEICLWLGKYQTCINVIQGRMNSDFQATSNQSVAWLRNAMLLGKFKDFWGGENPHNYESVSAIIYSYKNNQNNALVKHFDPDYPNKYWLAPSEVAVNRFKDNDFTPLGSSRSEDFRTARTFKQSNGKWSVCKFRPSTNRDAFRNDIYIYIYRGVDLYFMLAEAFNQLGNKEAVDALINNGVENYINEFDKNEDNVLSGTWNGFTPHWTSGTTMYTSREGKSELKARSKYGDEGIRGCRYTSYSGEDPLAFGENKQENDELILKEMMLEMACEGKVYPTMIRMARRYNDPSIMAKYIGEKYEGKGNAEAIRTKIMNGDYFIHWDLSTEK